MPTRTCQADRTTKELQLPWHRTTSERRCPVKITVTKVESLKLTMCRPLTCENDS